MRRADRLFQIVQHLRARRLTTAAQLSNWLRVSQRTVYRDIRDLSLSGVPVQGEAGVGYRVDRAYDLTPLMFTPDEVEAVVVGLRMAEAFAGPSLRSAARMALDKVALALPQLMAPYKQSAVDSPSRPLLLLALAAMLRHMPRTVLLANLNTVRSRCSHCVSRRWWFRRCR